MQKEEEAQVEAHERRRLEEELGEQQALIDALTAETMNLREEAATLQVKKFTQPKTTLLRKYLLCYEPVLLGSSQAELLQRMAELEQKLDTVVLVMGELGLPKANADPPEGSNVEAAVSYCFHVFVWL